MSDTIKKEKAEKAFSAFDARDAHRKYNINRRPGSNYAILQIAREADKAGFGTSYGKYVLENKL